VVHLGDDTDDRISPAELATNPYTPADDAAAGARRKEGILVHLPRVQASETTRTPTHTHPIVTAPAPRPGK